MINISIKKTLYHIKELAADVISIKNLPYEWFFYKKNPKIKNVNETIDLLLKGNSIVRFGDGEFYLMKGCSIPFQKNDKKLQEGLNQIFKNKIDNLLIGLPETFTTLNQYIPQEKFFWRKYMAINRSFIYKFIDFNENYVSAFFSRPYLRFKNKKNVSRIFKKIKKIWNKKNILIIEGDGTRIGVGNNLLDNTLTIKRIICPNTNAFDKYNQILETALKYKSDLILVALGPTAKILTFELVKNGRQTIDTGHLDIEYEWFLKRTKRRIPIKNKNVLEANSYNVEKCEDKNYQKQIVSVIK